MAFSPDGETIAAGYGEPAKGGGVVLCDAASQKRIGDVPLKVKEGYVSSVAFSPDGQTIAAGIDVFSGSIGGVVLWDTASRKRLRQSAARCEGDGENSVAFSPDGKTIAAAYGPTFGDGGVAVWDAGSRKRLGETARSEVEAFRAWLLAPTAKPLNSY